MIGIKSNKLVVIFLASILLSTSYLLLQGFQNWEMRVSSDQPAVNTEEIIGEEEAAVLNAQLLEEAQKALEENPNSARWHNQLGIIYYGLDEQSEAYNELSVAIELDPDNPLYTLNLALSYFYGNNPEGAVAYFEKTAELLKKCGDEYRDSDGGYVYTALIRKALPENLELAKRRAGIK
jgi:cytochrome c-type biogenesis protein CcmH/NrfG